MLAHRSQVSTQDRDEMRKSLSRRGGRQGRGGMVESFKRVHIGSSRPKPDAAKTQESNQTPAGAQP